MAPTKLCCLITLGLLSSYATVKCSRILGVFPFPGRSHYILGNSLMKGLAEAGHDVTVISCFEDKSPPRNGSYKNVLLIGFAEEFERSLNEVNFLGDSQRAIVPTWFMFKIIHSQMNRTFELANIKDLLNSGEKFDAVIVEQFFNDAYKIFAYHFNAPLILFSSVGPNDWVNDIVGNPSPLSYIPHMRINLPPNMTFSEKLKNLLWYLFSEIGKFLYFLPKNEKILKGNFPDCPSFFDLYYNASLVLLNFHESLGQSVPLVPNMIQIGGYHIKEPKILPKDLQVYLDEGTEGVVYFNMGSALKSADIPPETLNVFLGVFRKLKEKVLWKWESDTLPGQPSNVKLAKWLPQGDILGCRQCVELMTAASDFHCLESIYITTFRLLGICNRLQVNTSAHPNVKVFITHGGLLSLTEAVYHGIPILAIPVIADQHTNANDAVRSGYALSLPYNDPSFSEEKLWFMLNELLHNPKYRDTAKYRSKLFHDRPLKPMDNAIYWVEYIIRHKGAPHLRVAGVGMPWYKYFLLDVIGFIAGFVIFVVLSLYLGIKYVLVLLRHLRTSKDKKKRN